MSGLSEHVIKTFGITQAIVDAIGGVDAATYRAITDVFIERQHEQVVRCKDCAHSLKEGTLCMFFAAWAPIAGGDEYEKMPALAEPEGFCAWGERRGDVE